MYSIIFGLKDTVCKQFNFSYKILTLDTFTDKFVL